MEESSSLPSASSIHSPVSFDSVIPTPGTTSACSLTSPFVLSFQPIRREYFLRLSIEAAAKEPSSRAGLAINAVSKFPSSGFTPYTFPSVMLPSFPAATVTTIPAFLAFSNISVSGYFSPSMEKPADEPRLIFTTSAPKEMASSIALSHISVKVVGYCKSSENTLRASI